uniref:DDE Tnp4 domain-containing protein n=1 Tax=Chenopodium quinoa TaxID=63459 RepID=A0A803MP58_CHEQI
MIGTHFYRSGETISKQFHACLLAILKLLNILLKKPTPIQEDYDDERWKYFKNSLGALDGIMILVNVPCEDRSKYRTRKGTLAMNVLGVCSPEMEFIYVLPGWKGSAHDGRILRDAISRPNGLKVPKEALSELAVDPHWKFENGFGSGYMVHLEENIGKVLPGCGWKDMPHIDSRLKKLEAKFRAISTMLNTSGFVWGDSKKMVYVDRAVYDEFCKVLLDSSDDEGVAASGHVTQTVTSPP